MRHIVECSFVRDCAELGTAIWCFDVDWPVTRNTKTKRVTDTLGGGGTGAKQFAPWLARSSHTVPHVLDVWHVLCIYAVSSKADLSTAMHTAFGVFENKPVTVMGDDTLYSSLSYQKQ